MEIVALAIPDVKLVKIRRFGDDRGWLAETWREDVMAKAGFPSFVQDNQSYSARTGTVRGLHFQRPPEGQAKLVRAVAGRLLDVAVDLRRSSPTYGRHVAVELDAATGDQLLVPEGFAHGFCTLVPDTMLAYRVSRYFSPAHDAGVFWNDSAFGIDWPVRPDEATVSDKDRSAPRLADLGAVFD
jgi:dTDP-4-dehydrorhamnose 3,5-epimerase